jgi:hypothetical protein
MVGDTQLELVVAGIYRGSDHAAIVVECVDVNAANGRGAYR